MKKLIAVLMGGVVLFGPLSPLVLPSDASIISVGDPGRAWAQPNDAARGMHIQQFIDAMPNEIPSFLVRDSNGTNFTEDPTCKSLRDERCLGQKLSYSAVLPRCANDADIYCTVDFGTITESGVKTSGVFGRYFPDHSQNQYEGDTSQGLPNGTTGSIFSIPQAPHDGGDKYYLAAVLSGNVSATGEVRTSSIDLRITPVALEPDGYLQQSTENRDSGWALITDQNTGVVRWGRQAPGFGGNQYCVASSWREQMCAQKYAFPADVRYYVTLRLGSIPGGWMHGRISSPDIQIMKGSTSSVVEFRGNPIAVPTVYKMYQYTEMPPALKEWYDIEKGGYKPACTIFQVYCAGGRSGPSTDPLNRNVIIAPKPWDPFGMDQLKIWLPYVSDKATALLSFWSVRTLSANEMQGASKCFTDDSKITGIVTTNSTQYSAGPPKFDKGEGTLSYQVASPHYGTTGDVFKGTYDLVMRSDVARCLYGFSTAPIQASLSITSSDGSEQVATTIVGERDGWLSLSANGFTYSSPVIQAKLSQTQPAAPMPIITTKPELTTQAATKPPTKKVTIACVKGKVKKKFTGFNPTCPSGYKKSVK